MTDPAPNPVVLHAHWPTSWPDLHPNFSSNALPVQMGKGLAIYLRAGFEHYGADVLTVMLPIMVGYTVIVYVFGKLGIAVGSLERNQEAVDDLETQRLYKGKHRVSGGSYDPWGYN